MDKITFKLPLRKTKELKNVKDPEAVKREIGDYILEEILNHVASGNSPVKGNGKFKALSSNYKKVKGEISSSLIPNMELNGDMLDSLEYRLFNGGVEIGIWGEEADKADGHNQHSGRSTPLPKRRFIPKPGEDTFKQNILREVDLIIKENEE
jgi:hypothetical protein